MIKEKIIIFGTGRACEHFIQSDFEWRKFDLLAFADNNETKWNGNFCDKVIISPDNINSYEYDHIIIASTYFLEIKKQLVEQWGILESKIHNMYYRMDEEVKKRHEIYYQKNKKSKLNSCHPIIKQEDKIVIYTVISGNYDELKEPKYIDSRCKYVCYTDNLNITSKVWDLKLLEVVDGDYNRSAKKLKILPHEYFPSYDWSIYVDGKFQIKGDLVKLINQYVTDSSFLSFMHYKRNCIKEEAETCIKLGFDNETIIKEQINGYFDMGFLDDNELIEGGILMRRHNDAELIKVMESWWREITMKSKRDQLSFNYVAWKQSFFFDLVDMHAYDNEYVKRFPHKKR